MKKTLAAIAVLGAFAGSAFAADVQVYGRIDTGISVHDYDMTDYDGVKTDGTDWGMVSGGSTTSRVGIKGSEVISEGLKIGFNLEAKLNSDTGSAFADGFDRESVLWAETDYGTFYAGKIGTMWSDGGATNFWAGNYVAFGTGANDGMAQGTGFMVAQSRVANRISYKSPTFAGFTAYAEYSFGTGTKDADDETVYNENTSKDNRPAALGLDYHNGAFGMGLVVTYTNEASISTKTGLCEDQEDEYTINLGTSYDFGVAKVMLAGQYFKNADKVGYFNDEDVGVLPTGDEYKGYALTLGTDVPAWGGTWTAALSYADGESDADVVSGTDVYKNLEFKGYNAGLMYKYPLSKRTRVYAGVGYNKMEADADNWSDTAEYESTRAVVGMAHFF